MKCEICDTQTATIWVEQVEGPCKHGRMEPHRYNERFQAEVASDGGTLNDKKCPGRTPVVSCDDCGPQLDGFQLETRSLLGWEVENPDVYKQRAIPWCTTHDDRATYMQDECRFVQQFGNEPEGSMLHQAFELAAQFISGGAECVISTGGPDHKWWKDTE